MIFATWKIRGWSPWRLSVMNILSASLLWDDSGWNSMIARRARMPEQKFDEEEAFPYTTVGTDDAKRMIEAGAHIIDVRQPDEWDRGHIPGAVLVPLNGIYAFGQRSAVASEIALLIGLKKVYNLANGMHGWVSRRYPVER